MTKGLPAEDRELDVDYSERAGFLTGKAAALADWAHRKEAKAFAKLEASLRVRRWRQLEPEKAKDLNRRNDLRRRARRHDERVELRKGQVLTCGWCGTQWCRIPRPKMGPTPKFCSAEHGKLARYARDRKDPAKRADAVERACAWQRANVERSREIRREWARRKRAAKAAT